MTRPAYRQVRRSYWSWIRAVAGEIRNEVRRTVINAATGERREVYPAGERSQTTVRRALESRASKLVRCMRRVEGRVCGDSADPAVGCGRPRTRGVFRMKAARRGARCRGSFEHGNERCHLRSCPRCARIRAAAYHDFGSRLVTLFEANKAEQIARWGANDYRPKLITLTARRDPADREAHTVEALKRRARGLRDAFRAIIAWDRDRVRAPEWVGAFVSLELAGTGHVHLHCLYHGPFVDTDEHNAPVEWIRVGRDGYTDRKGRVFPGYADLGYVGDVRKADPRAIAEVAKYAVKSPGTGSEGAEAWIGGRKKTLMNPVLVARWEVATYGVRLCERYGLCRKVDPPEEDDDRLCPSCVNRDHCTRRDDTLTRCGDYTMNLCAVCARRDGCGAAAAWVVLCDRFDNEQLLGAPSSPCVCGCATTKLVNYPTKDWLALCRVARCKAFGTADPRIPQNGENHGDGKTGQKGQD